MVPDKIDGQYFRVKAFLSSGNENANLLLDQRTTLGDLRSLFEDAYEGAPIIRLVSISGELYDEEQDGHLIWTLLERSSDASDIDSDMGETIRT